MFPLVSLDVLLALSKAFPDQAQPTSKMKPREVLWRGGQVSVVRFLQRMYDEQNILSPEDDAQDVLAQP